MIYQHKFIILSFSRAIINQSYGNAIYRINGNRAKMIYVSIENNIRDLFKVKLYIIRSKLKREREREQDFKYLLTLILTGGHK